MRFILVLILSAISAGAATFAPYPSNSVPWGYDYQGVPGGIPYRTTIASGIAPGASTATINSAINAAASNRVVFLTNGSYTLTDDLDMKSGITLRGESTNVVINVANFSILMGPFTAKNAGTTITNGFTKGDSNLVVSSTSGLSVNMLVHLDQTDDTNMVWNNSASGRNLAQEAIITAISGQIVTVWPPLIYTFQTNRDFRLKHYSGNQIEYAGLENLTLTYGGSTSEGVFIDQAYGCWMSNVFSVVCNNQHVTALAIQRCTFKNNIFWDAEDYDANHGGINFYEDCDHNVIEDNIFYRCPPPVKFDAGGSADANVVGYNFSHDSFQTGFGQYNAIWLGHGGHNFMNLAEGNYCNGVTLDGYHSSASHTTVFRNRLHGWTPTFPVENSKAINFCKWSKYCTVAANVIGRTQQHATDFYKVNTEGWTDGGTLTTIFALGYPNTGNEDFTGTRPPNNQVNPGADDSLDLNVESTLRAHHNYILGAGINALTNSPGEETTMPDSLYLTSKPNWLGNLSWPLIGPGVNTTDNSTNQFLTPGEVTNGARERYYGSVAYLSGGQDPTPGVRGVIRGKSAVIRGKEGVIR